MKQRVDFCKAILNDYSKHNDNALYNVVHIEEKWFYITKICRRFYLWHDEENMPRHVQSKSHITKVMFMVVVARPRSDWDGKLGCWPLVVGVHSRPTNKRESASRRTCHDDGQRHEAGLPFVIPSIKEKWRWLTDDNEGVVYLQQDNARVHVAADGPTVVAATEYATFRIQVRNPPPQSPDLNVLDLGVFNSIQAFQQTMECKIIDDLGLAIELSFDELAPMILGKTFATLHRVIKAVLHANGGNSYKTPRSKDTDDDMINLELLDQRIEEESRLDELYDLVNSTVV
ncbi:hypothetical protein H257_17323 [Aphanomyces astaci]|uniref:DDE-1 domain-containing protein n=1 Tax=Aphanomyces astaci TaxID=112090 RepID=W4FH76_APHAT|nr:hypothetical protein H257_17323 [Aphanomyces astaci]ETV66171.1 hypothetical protein H257_17323 [Aphanomyces astaci]|eukprot:XP_009844360.1 hypothetical protein H257_17323 [Aphanomyces astaci]